MSFSKLSQSKAAHIFANGNLLTCAIRLAVQHTFFFGGAGDFFFPLPVQKKRPLLGRGCNQQRRPQLHCVHRPEPEESLTQKRVPG